MDASVFDDLEVNNDFLPDGVRRVTQEETAQWLLDDGPVLKTTWTVYDRQFPDGQRELCVTRTTRIKQNGPLPLRNRARRGESEKREQNDDDSAKRAKQQVRLRCKQIGADRMVTLTYRENMQDKERLLRDWDTFRRRMSKYKEFHYVAAVERQEGHKKGNLNAQEGRSAFHIHVAVHGRQDYKFLKKVWLSIVGEGMGYAHVRNPNDFYKARPRGATKDNRELQHLIAAYLSKYITKDADDHELNAKRYWSSRGIVIPEQNYYQLPYGTTESEAFAHILQIAADHNNAGMVFFGNQALGVCWVATAPSQNVIGS
ncbi:hypothetical protein EGT07_08105 [Herbaspirillum sp. HC18]|nr:hypothetical protein EGT07_08105 [Herbaspirillum sp. HC18]